MIACLAAKSFINKDIYYNKKQIIETICDSSNKADLIVFGEAFLQGFDCLSWNYEEDINMALSINDEIINEIREKAKEKSVAISFGYIEKDEENIYSSQLTIDKNGDIINNYRRVSIGWKERKAGNNYKEGCSFYLFKYNNISFSIGLCGDMWDDDNVNKMKELRPEVVLWPVYLDYNYNEWNNSIKYEYSIQAQRFCDKVLCVNSFCLDKDEDEIAKGGACYFEKGKIKEESLAGKESLLFVEI